MEAESRSRHIWGCLVFWMVLSLVLAAFGCLLAWLWGQRHSRQLDEMKSSLDQALRRSQLPVITPLGDGRRGVRRTEGKREQLYGFLWLVLAPLMGLAFCVVMALALELRREGTYYGPHAEWFYEMDEWVKADGTRLGGFVIFLAAAAKGVYLLIRGTLRNR